MIVKSLKKKPSKDQLIQAKATKEELNKIKKKAKDYAGGNISAWIRIASIHFTPKKNQIVGF